MKILDLDNNNKLLANKNDTLTKSLDKYEEDYSELLNVYFINFIQNYENLQVTNHNLDLNYKEKEKSCNEMIEQINELQNNLSILQNDVYYKYNRINHYQLI